MSDVYSVSIAQVEGLTTPETVTVPSGKVFVVRDMWAYWNSPTSLGAKLYVQGDHDQTFWFASWDQLTADPLAFWQGRTVLQDHMTFYADNGPVDFTASGYLLSLP